MEIRETRDPACPPDHRFGGWKIELMDGDAWASRLWVVDKEMRIGATAVRIGGISSVETPEAYRGKGLASQVMEASLRLMEREGFQATILHGIPDFYHRFGYAACMPEYELRLQTADAERAQGTATLREARDSDWPAIARLYNGENAARPGTVLRDAATWKGFPRSVGFFTKPGVKVAVDARDRVTGYVVYDDAKDRCRAAEVGGLSGDVLGSLLRFLADRAVELRKEEVALAIPPDSAMGVFARKFGCEARIRYARNGEFMGRAIDLPALLERVAEGLGRGSDLPLPDGRVTLSTDLGACSLAVEKGRAKSDPHPVGSEEAPARLGQGALFQMLMGYRTARDLLAAGELQASSDQVERLAAWFPLRNACMYWPDRF